MPEIHILIFQFFISLISASLIPAQGELVMLAFLASGKYTDWLLFTVACAGTLAGGRHQLDIRPLFKPISARKVVPGAVFVH